MLSNNDRAELQKKIKLAVNHFFDERLPQFGLSDTIKNYQLKIELEHLELLTCLFNVSKAALETAILEKIESSFDDTEISPDILNQHLVFTLEPLKSFRFTASPHHAFTNPSKPVEPIDDYATQEKKDTPDIIYAELNFAPQTTSMKRLSHKRSSTPYAALRFFQEQPSLVDTQTAATRVGDEVQKQENAEALYSAPIKTKPRSRRSSEQDLSDTPEAPKEQLVTSKPPFQFVRRGAFRKKTKIHSESARLDEAQFKS